MNRSMQEVVRELDAGIYTAPAPGSLPGQHGAAAFRRPGRSAVRDLRQRAAARRCFEPLARAAWCRIRQKRSVPCGGRRSRRGRLATLQLADVMAACAGLVHGPGRERPAFTMTRRDRCRCCLHYRLLRSRTSRSGATRWSSCARERIGCGSAKREFPGLATRDAPTVASIGCTVLGPDWLARTPKLSSCCGKLPLASGVASHATYDPDTGEPVRALYDAALAGFVAWSLAFAQSMRILFVTSEALPYFKSGGLADVARSLPDALQP